MQHSQSTPFPLVHSLNGSLRVALAWPGETPWQNPLLHLLGAMGHEVVLVRAEVVGNGDCDGESADCEVHEELRAGLSWRTVRLEEQASESRWRGALQEALGDCDLLHAIPGEEGGAGASGRGPCSSTPFWIAEACQVLPTVLHWEALPSKGQDTTLWQTVLDRCAKVVFSSRSDVVHAAERWKLTPSRTELQASVAGLVPTVGTDSEGLHPGRRWDGLQPLRVLHRANPGQPACFRRLVEVLSLLPPGSVQVVCLASGEQEELPATGHRVPITCVTRLDGAAMQSVARTCHVAAYPGEPDRPMDAAVEEALGLGLPVMTTGGVPSLERHGMGSIQTLPAGDTQAWRQAFELHLQDASALQEAFDGLPVTMGAPSAAKERAERLDALYRRVGHSQAA